MQGSKGKEKEQEKRKSNTQKSTNGHTRGEEQKIGKIGEQGREVWKREQDTKVEKDGWRRRRATKRKDR